MVFDIPVTTSALLPAGMLGLTVVIREGGRQFRFTLHSARPGRGGSDDAAETLMNAIRYAFDREGGEPVVEDVVIHLKADSISLTCQKVTAGTLLSLLRQLLANARTLRTVPEVGTAALTISSPFALM